MGHRNVRVSDALWSAALERAASEHTTVTAVINDALRAYTGLAAAAPRRASQVNAAAVRTAQAAAARRAPGSVGTAERRVAAAAGKPLDHLGEPCAHPKARIMRGLCMACGEAVAPAG